MSLFGGFGSRSGGGGASQPPPGDDDQEQGDWDESYVDQPDDELYDDDADIDGARVISDFDPSALERGAKALRAIDKSDNAKMALKLSLSQERTKQEEARLKAHELEGRNLAMREEVAKREYDYKSKGEQDSQQKWKERVNAEQKFMQQTEQRKLEEKRRTNKEWLQHQKELFEQQQALQKQTEKEIEDEKRRTLDYQAKLDRETAKVRAQAETEGAIERERTNEDVQTRKLKARLEEERKTKMDLRKEDLKYYAEFAKGCASLLTDPVKLPLLVGGVSGMALGIYGAKMSMSVIGKYIESTIGKPSLVRETSRFSWQDYTPGRLFNRLTDPSKKKGGDWLDGVILQPSVQNKIEFIGRSTQKTRENKAPFRHLLIHGPPGTGKTLFARTLAQNSGLDYAVVTGGDFAPLGSNAVTELHKVFDWAERSRNGTILFIDEADAFLRMGREDKASMSEDMRNALSAFLYRTGTETTKFMVVLATNLPETLDRAVIDRVDEVVKFPLPGPNERERLLQHYFNQYIEDPTIGSKIETKGFNEDKKLWTRLAKQSDGFSGRQIAKYLIHVQATVYGGMEKVCTPALMEQIMTGHLASRLAPELNRGDKPVFVDAK